MLQLAGEVVAKLSSLGHVENINKEDRQPNKRPELNKKPAVQFAYDNNYNDIQQSRTDVEARKTHIRVKLIVMQVLTLSGHLTLSSHDFVQIPLCVLCRDILRLLKMP